MTKRDDRLRLSPRAIVVLVVFVILMLVGTYLFAGYMLTGSWAICGSAVGDPCLTKEDITHERQGDRRGGNLTPAITPKVTQKITSVPTKKPDTLMEGDRDDKQNKVRGGANK